MNKSIKIGSIAVENDRTVKTITLGNLKLKTIYDIELFVSREGNNIPHFHMIPRDNKYNVVCIKLFSAEYFKHGSKQGTLNKTECIALNNFLNQFCILVENKEFKYNNWQFMVYKWYQSHNEPCTKEVIDELRSKQPDYSNIQ